MTGRRPVCGVERSLWLEAEGATRELIPHLVVAVAPRLSAETESVIAFDYGNVIEYLEGVIAVDVRTFARLAEAADAVAEADGRRAPRRLNRRSQPGNLQFRCDIALVGEPEKLIVLKLVVTEAELIYRRGPQVRVLESMV
jgi:hypothetical protein